MSLKMSVREAVVLLLLFSFCTLEAQPSQEIKPIGESAHRLFDLETLDMDYNGKAFRLYIANPISKSEVVRPVLYMLDGNGQFPVLVNGVEEVSDKTPVIVGIGYPSPMAFPKERTRDYTIPVEGRPEGGGAADFYRFLIEKVKPFIEAEYPVDTSRQTLCGHSHGGLFTLFVLFNHTKSFQHYVVASPSTWWGEGAILPKDRPLLSYHPQSVTITTGEYEENPELDVTRRKVSSEVRKIKEQRKGGIPPRRLAALLAEEISDCRFIVFEKKNHGSSVPDFLKVALDVASGKDKENSGKLSIDEKEFVGNSESLLNAD